MPESSPVTAICRRVREHFEARGVPERSQSGEVARILALSSSQAYRKLTGATPFTTVQLETLARHLHVSVAALIADGSGQREEPVDVGLQPALLHLHALLPCHFRPGVPLDESLETPPFLARRKEGQWQVYPGDMAEPEAGDYAVERLVLDLEKPEPRVPRVRVAILDDDSADILAEVLRLQGFHCTPFQEGNSLLQAMATQTFEIVLLDWVLGSVDGSAVLPAIRERAPAGMPVLLLTGHAQEHERTLAAALQQDNVHYATKPIPGAVLAAQIRNALRS